MKTLQTLFIILVLYGTSLACGNFVLVMGRVVNHGRPVANAIVSAGGYIGRTSPFGYYSLYVPNCGSYKVFATSKEVTFPAQSLQLPVDDQNVFEIDFINIYTKQEMPKQ